MASAAWALQQGVYQVLANDAELTALLGGANVFDDVPQEARYPYLTLGQSVVRDWSTSTEAGSEHILTLHAWSRAAGKKETEEILGRVRDALHDAAISLQDHALINLRHEASETRRDPDGETYHGIARFRAVTEPAD